MSRPRLTDEQIHLRTECVRNTPEENAAAAAAYRAKLEYHNQKTRAWKQQTEGVTLHERLQHYSARMLAAEARVRELEAEVEALRSRLAF